MSDWQRFFSRKALERGRKYFRQGNVVEYWNMDGDITAVVRGERSYSIRIRNCGSNSPKFSCSCPNFQDGYRCKHLAAVMYMYEKDQKPVSGSQHSPKERNSASDRASSLGSVKEKSEPLKQAAELFDGDMDRSDLNYAIPSMVKDLWIRESDRMEALRKVDTGELTLDKRDLSFKKEYDYASRTEEMCADAWFSMNRLYGSRKEIRLVFSPSAAKSMSCSVCGISYYNAHSKKRIICAHLGAAMILLDRHMCRYNPGDFTDHSGERLLKLLQGNGTEEDPIPEDEAEKTKVVRLEPQIVGGYQHLELAFRIGIQKMYVLKDLSELRGHVQNEENMTLGKYQSIQFGEQTFTEDSEPFWQLIEEELERIDYSKQRMSESRYYHPGVIKDAGTIQLTGKILDTLYDIAVEQYDGKIPVKSSIYDAKSPYCRFGQFHAQATIHVSPLIGARFTGIHLEGEMPLTLKGMEYTYVIDYKNLTVGRMENRDPGQDSMRRLFRMASKDGKFSADIGRKYLGRFFYDILPRLQNSEGIQVIIEEEEEILRQLNPQPRFTFYLDREGERAICRPEVSYGEEKFLVRPLEEDLPLERIRDMDSEEQVIQTLLQYFPEYDMERQEFLTAEDGEALYDLLEQGLDDLERFGELQSTDRFQSLQIHRKLPIQIGVGIEGNLLDLKIQTEGIRPEELREVLNSYRRKKRFHKLKSGAMVALDPDSQLDSLIRLLDSMGMTAKDITDGEMKLPLYRAIYLDQMLQEKEGIRYETQRSFRRLLRNFKSVKESDYDEPESLQADLRKYQVYGYKWLRTLGELGFNGILADDMGLGKTLQTIAVLTSDVQEGTAGGEQRQSLIVCPSSLVYNWQEEFRRFSPGLKIEAVAGNAASRKAILRSTEQPDVLITSYDLLKRDIKMYEDRTFSYQVIDEAQYIKNPKSAAAKSVKVIQSAHRIALTGTPIENRLSELWSIFDYLMPGFLYGYDQFRQNLETPIVKNKDEEATEKLRNMVNPFILRRLKQDVLKELPEKNEEVRYAGFDEEQQKLYDAQVAYMKHFLETADNKDKIKILAEITKVRQICCDPSLIFENYTGESAKRQAALELIQSAIEGGHRILLFSQFTSMLELLEEDLQKNKITYFKITGSTSKENRIQMVHEFNQGDTPVFLISLKAGGTGLNLTGADMVIHYDPWWNMAAQNQATDRAHRIGQTRNVTVYKLIARGTIEEKILQLQERKRDLADAVISGENTSLTSLSKEEILQLFES